MKIRLIVGSLALLVVGSLAADLKTDQKPRMMPPGTYYLLSRLGGQAEVPPLPTIPIESVSVLSKSGDPSALIREYPEAGSKIYIVNDIDEKGAPQDWSEDIALKRIERMGKLYSERKRTNWMAASSPAPMVKVARPPVVVNSYFNRNLMKPGLGTFIKEVEKYRPGFSTNFTAAQLALTNPGPVAVSAPQSKVTP